FQTPKFKGLEFFKSVEAWVPMICLPAAALMLRGRMPAWVFMWLMALGIFAGCKWVTWRRAREGGLKGSLGRLVGYLLAWPGMDAAAFLSGAKRGAEVLGDGG